MKTTISMSATVIMMGIMLLTGQADVQEEYQEEIQEEFKIDSPAAVEPLKIDNPDSGLIARTHDVHMYAQEDADLIKRIALAEGETEGADGMWMIMSVIINRLNDPEFPDTVQGVVYQKNVFSCLKDGNFAKAKTTTPEAEEAWSRIEAGDVCPEIVAFEGLQSNVLDAWFSEAFTYRNHKFYTKKLK